MGDCTDSAVMRVDPSRHAASRTFTGEGTAIVVTEKFTETLPAGTFAVAGTVATPGSSLPSVTAAPPVPAARSSCTVPVADSPPSTEDGVTEISFNFVLIALIRRPAKKGTRQERRAQVKELASVGNKFTARVRNPAPSARPRSPPPDP